MNLTVYQNSTQEPVLVLNEDAYGLKVVGGDPKLVKALKLDQFRTLKDIADYLNSAGSPYQAIFDPKAEENANAQSSDPAEDLDERLKPAISILKELLSRVEDRKSRDQAAEEAKKPEAEMLQNPNVQIVGDDMTPHYVSLDGDNIGNAVARAEEKDDEKTLAEMSARINAGQDILKQWAIRMGGKVIEQGGDEGLVKVPGSALAHIEELREQYKEVVGATCTVGVGKKISESTKARMLGKLKGKNQTVVFDESTQKELNLRLEDSGGSGNEAKKIRTAMTDTPAFGSRGDGSQSEVQGENTDQDRPRDQEAQPQASPNGAAQGNQAATGEPEEEPDTSEESPNKKGSDSKVKKSELSPELLKAAQDYREPKKTSSLFNSPHYDEEIENADYSQSEDPNFAKALRYLMKYGARNG